MSKIKFSYKGEEYDARVIHYKDEDYTIAPIELLDALQPNPVTDEDDGFLDDAGRKMYDAIFYFTDKETLELPDEELIEELQESNPDIFDDEED